MATFPLKCQYCGRTVWFHSDENGGKVFFNELGWPWEKHDCCGQQEFIPADELEKYRSSPARRLQNIKELAAKEGRSNSRFHAVMTESLVLGAIAFSGMQFAHLCVTKVSMDKVELYVPEALTRGLLEVPLAELKTVTRRKGSAAFLFLSSFHSFFDAEPRNDIRVPAQSEMEGPWRVSKRSRGKF